MTGRQIGHYTILSPLGAGGMGEVYRARDSKLGRDVAIKILPPRFSDNPELRARLVREARLLATLNHPHIGAIYGLEDADGVTALVLELVEGPTLAECLRSGPLPTTGALAVGSQIAEALEAAHDKGIIHRDLKPSNVILQGGVIGTGIQSRALRARVLDFGVAKIIGGESENAESRPPSDPTITREGGLVGTPSYMSPEQALGLAVDKRTDIWAFGCVLFEMLTGARAFDGTAARDGLRSVLDREPDWSALPAATPDTVRRLLRRCLEKDCSYRLRDIGDARLELEEATPREAASGARAKWSRWLASPTLPLIGAGSFITIVAFLSITADYPFRLGFWSRARDLPFDVTRLMLGEGLQLHPALSPDGHLIAYSSNAAGNFDIYTQPVSGGNSVRVTAHSAHDWQPDWSSTAQIVFRSERDEGGLYVVGPTGGEERRLAPFGHWPLWSPDGTKVLFARRDSHRLYIVDVDGTPPRICQSCYGMATGAYGWYRDTRQVSLLTTGPGPHFEPIFRIVDPESGAVVRWPARPAVLSGFRDLGVSIVRSALTWSPDGSAIHFTGYSKGVSAVWRLDVSPDDGRLTGGPRRMATMSDDSTGLTIARATGTMAFAAVRRTPRIWWYPLDGSGRRLEGSPEPLTPDGVAALDHDVTPDGTRLVFTTRRSDVLGAEALTLRSLDEQADRTLRVSDPSSGERRDLLRLSPDGRYVALRYTPPERDWPEDRRTLTPPQQLRLLDLVTAEESELTTLQTVYVMPHGWSSDGRFVLATVPRGIHQDATGMAIGLLPVSAAPNAERHMKVVTRSPGPGGVFRPSVSSNGQWIAFEVPGDINRIAVVGSKDGQWNAPLDERDWQYLEARAALYGPRWSLDGRLLYFVSGRGGFANVWTVEFDPLTAGFGVPFQVTEFGGRGEEMGVFTVGRGRLAINTIHPMGGIWLLHPPRATRVP